MRSAAQCPRKISVPQDFARLPENRWVKHCFLRLVRQVQTLPRIGPSLAARIISWRDAHGGFKSVDELDAVPGIGPSLMSSLRPLVTV